MQQAVPWVWLCVFFAIEIAFGVACARLFAKAKYALGAIASLLNGFLVWFCGAIAFIAYEDLFDERIRGAPIWSLASMAAYEKVTFISWQAIPVCSLVCALTFVAKWVRR